MRYHKVEEKASEKEEGPMILWSNWLKIFGYTWASKLHRTSVCPLARARGTAWLTSLQLTSFQLWTGWSCPYFLVGHRASPLLLHFCLIKLLANQHYVSPQWLTQTLGHCDRYGPYPQLLMLKVPPGSHPFNPTSISDRVIIQLRCELLWPSGSSGIF